MPKSKPQHKPHKSDDKPRSKERVEDLPVKDDQAAAVKGGLTVKLSDIIVTKK